ncbi:UV-stimulated scaffold protein A-like isoform X2 [Ischnura elegans]|uniref:UV-stimulated scaffold protein A-like isoform X2 n=1 Tax=Ischnura elegans TaxID=197161 RepID=UPI001ED88253|nr:UV-stimulated scaffold protein A-like isoform X2 [Ischnura elegans]
MSCNTSVKMKRVDINRKQKAVKDTSPSGQIKSIIQELTHSGQKELDGKLISSLRNFCKQSEDYVRKSYQMVMHQLEKDHAEVRYSAFLIIDDFFRRSHAFRELLLSDMRQYMELTMGINEDNPLPLPSHAAKNMKKKALHAVHEWNQKYGSAYKKLSLAYKYLKNCFQVDFGELVVQNSIEHQRQLEIERKKQEFLEAKSKKILQEVEENEEEIRQTLTSMENCLSLLLPHPKDFFLDTDIGNDAAPSTSIKKSIDGRPGTSHDNSENTPEEMETKEMPHTSSVIQSDEQKTHASPNHASLGETETDQLDNEEFMEPESEDDSMSSSSDSEYGLDGNINLREYGVLNPHASITIDLNPKPANLRVTEENSVVAENARDLFVILSNRHLVDVKKWIQILTKSSHAEKLKSLIFLKNSIESVLTKYQELNLPAKKLKTDDSDDSDSDFEEVQPKEDYEEKVIEPLPSTSQGTGSIYPKSSKIVNKGDVKPEWSIISPENNPEDPTSVLSTVSKMVGEKVTKGKKTADGPSGVKVDKNKKSGPNTSGEHVPAVASSSKETRKSKLLAAAPKVPFDLDLYHWENEKVPSSVMMTSHPDAQNIWTTAALDTEDAEIPKELSGSVRVIEFSGKFTPVKWTCRAPLPSGKLCPRKDRVKFVFCMHVLL